MAHDRSPEARTLEALRRSRGLSQRVLSETAGVHKATISKYERGGQIIGQANLSAMLAALEFSPRAWEATVRHFVWLDYLSGRSADDLPTVEAVAESFGREVERHVVALLRVLRQQASV